MRITRELWNEIIVEIEEYIPKLVAASDSVGELFYEPLNEQGNGLFSQYITGLSNLIETMMMTLNDAVDHAPQMIERSTPVLESITSCVSNIEHALEKQNFVDIADIIKYELVEQLNLLLIVIKESR